MTSYKCPGCKTMIDYSPISVSPDPDSEAVCYDCLPYDLKVRYDAFHNRSAEDGFTTEKAVAHLQSVFDGNQAGVTKFVVTAAKIPDNIDIPFDQMPIAIKIEGTAKGYSSLCVTVIVGEAEWNDEAKRCLEISAANIALALIDSIEAKMKAAVLKAASNN